MSTEIWLTLLACAAGTFLLRMLPLLWMQRHLRRRDPVRPGEAMPLWLTVLAPTMIAAMLGVSLIPVSETASGWLATVLASVVTVLVWRRTRSLGWPVCAGVGVFGLVSVLALLSM